MTGNEKLTDYMAGARKHSSNGELLRMLEWCPHKKLIWNAEERKTLLEIKRNYGVAGEAWVRWLAVNQKTAEEIVRKVHIHLKKVFNFNDDERYWHAGCTTTVAAAILLRKEYSGILDVEINKVINVIANPAQFNFPTWFLNRQRDYKDGKNYHKYANLLDAQLREDVERMKKARQHRGLRHFYGHRVRGQHTKTTGRGQAANRMFAGK
jgi:ribosomal protein S13